MKHIISQEPSSSSRFDADEIRAKWNIGDSVYVYSQKFWRPGKITSITNDEEGEWLVVIFKRDNQTIRKEIQRDDCYITSCDLLFVDTSKSINHLYFGFLRLNLNGDIKHYSSNLINDIVHIIFFYYNPIVKPKNNKYMKIDLIKMKNVNDEKNKLFKNSDYIKLNIQRILN